MIKCNVLVTNAGSVTATAVIKALSGEVETIYGTDMNDFCLANLTLKEKFFKVSSLKEEQKYKEELIKICLQHNIKYIIPCTIDEELIFLAKHKAEFNQLGIYPVVSELSAIEVCDDKLKTSRYAEKIGLNIPKIFSIGDNPKPSDFPLILKSKSGNGAEHLHKIKDSQELEFWLKRVPNPFIQELVEGAEYTLDTISDLNGKVVACVCRERVQVKSGIAVKAHIVDIPEYITITKQLIESLGIIGPCNTQIIGGKLIEVNPRFSGGLGLSLASGINLPLLCIKLLEKIPLSASDLRFEKDIKVLRYWKEEILR